MALHLETSCTSGWEAVIFRFAGIQAESTTNQLMSTGSILAMTAVKRRKGTVRSRTVAVGFVLIVALAVATGSVLLIGYVAAAASVLTVLTLLVERAIRRESIAPTESFVPRWADVEDREAA